MLALCTCSRSQLHTKVMSCRCGHCITDEQCHALAPCTFRAHLLNRMRAVNATIRVSCTCALEACPQQFEAHQLEHAIAWRLRPTSQTYLTVSTNGADMIDVIVHVANDWQHNVCLISKLKGWAWTSSKLHWSLGAPWSMLQTSRDMTCTSFTDRLVPARQI